MNDPVERTIVRLTQLAQFTPGDFSMDLAQWDRPIHFAGAAVHFQNESPNTRIIYVEDSPDAVNWSLIAFSTPAVGGQLSITIREHGQRAILFVTSRRYVRFRLDAACPEGIVGVVSQFPPKQASPAGYGD